MPGTESTILEYGEIPKYNKNMDKASCVRPLPMKSFGEHGFFTVPSVSEDPTFEHCVKDANDNPGKLYILTTDQVLSTLMTATKSM